MKLHVEHQSQQPKPGLLAVLVLLGVIGFFLGVEAKAADVEDVSPEHRGLVLHRGSLIEITDDLDFSLSREKRFCDGQDAGFFRSLMSTDCCVIRIHALQVSNRSQIVMKRGIRAIVEIPENADYALIESKYPTRISCGDKAPTTLSLEKAMGNRVRVHKVEVPVQARQVKPVEQSEEVTRQMAMGNINGATNSSPEIPAAVAQSAATSSDAPQSAVQNSSQPAVTNAPAEENPFKVDEI